MIKTKIYKTIFVGSATALLVATNAFAYTIEQTSSTSQNDFVLDQAKVELKLKPGESARVPLIFTNQTQKEKEFEIMQEDIAGSANGSDAVVLLGDQMGEFSAKSYITPETKSFTLKPGEKITFYVDVKLPENMEPGGRYASVIFTNKSSSDVNASKTISRLASLFFIEVLGNTTKDGQLENFTISKKFLTDDATTTFSIAFRNNGNVHLDPYGQINVTTLFGQTVEQIEIKPFYAMPKSLRMRTLDWKPNYSFGIYKVDLQLNRGYNDITDQKGFYVVAFSWRIALYVLAGLLVLFGIYKLITSEFSISVKK